MLDRTYRARFLAGATLDALVYVGACGLAIDYLVHARRADRDALTYPGALCIVDLDDYSELLAFPFPHVGHDRHLLGEVSGRGWLSFFPN